MNHGKSFKVGRLGRFRFCSISPRRQCLQTLRRDSTEQHVAPLSIQEVASKYDSQIDRSGDLSGHLLLSQNHVSGRTT